MQKTKPDGGKKSKANGQRNSIENGLDVADIQVGWVLHMPRFASIQGLSKEGEGVRSLTGQ